ncbi:nuclear transport factor 2 family protein [Arthrobacter sp. NtRootA1]|uniref:nuclear transport factor 2 family protein n=1 Tax=Micrococcaceae TaxID=1268 RepID=UPI001CC5FF27|nr:nuclear transport factor 2 family protein [Arthrobacter sp. NtRootA1]BCW05880.1 bile-acid 7-alpha-dehydratase [Arthrobacter sp. NtRootA1]
MDDVQRLIAVEEIKRLKSRYFRALDKKDWDAFAANFTDDIIFDFTESDTGQDVDELVQHVYRVEGAKEAAAWARDALGDAVTSHHGHMPDIDILDDESAIGTWSLNDQIWFPPGSEFRFSKLEGYGHYEETYKRVDGAWKVASAKFIRHHAVWTVRGDD